MTSKISTATRTVHARATSIDADIVTSILCNISANKDVNVNANPSEPYMRNRGWCRLASGPEC